MILGADLLVPVAQVAIDATAPDRVRGIVGIGHRKALEDAELGLDQVQPGGLGVRPHGMDVQVAHEGHDRRVVVNVVEVIQDEVQGPARIAGAQAPEGLTDVDHAFVLGEQSLEAVGVHVVEAQELFGALQASIRRPLAHGALALGPRHPADGAKFERAPLVEAHYRGAARAPAVEPTDAFFLASKRGSLDVFQVRMRWALSPSRRSSRRTHSSVTSGNSPLPRQYSASFGTDQLEKGSPRSPGLDSATSTRSRNCAARKIGGRPLGLATCSKVAKPLSLKRCTQSYATVKWQPIRSAASTIVCPLATSSTTRYRWWMRAANDRSRSLRRSVRRSTRESERSCSDRGILPLPVCWGYDRIPRIRPIKLVQH